MRTIEHTIDIPAPTSEVWDVLAATDQYGVWNPFMPRLDGVLETGTRLAVTIRPGKRSMTFKPTVVALERGRLVRWQGRLIVRGIFDGEHELRLSPTPDGGTRFTQTEKFTGLLIPLMRGTLHDTERGFAAMNQALYERTLALRSR
ncbi:MAG: Polyketide cyclase/dehydrase [Nocardioides sp.]|nr:Polyketide cyclase/dehydrase [Nocardioides sp.]